MLGSKNGVPGGPTPDRARCSRCKTARGPRQNRPSAACDSRVRRPAVPPKTGVGLPRISTNVGPSRRYELVIDQILINPARCSHGPRHRGPPRLTLRRRVEQPDARLIFEPGEIVVLEFRADHQVPEVFLEHDLVLNEVAEEIGAAIGGVERDIECAQQLVIDVAVAGAADDVVLVRPRESGTESRRRASLVPDRRFPTTRPARSK